ncbi:MAG: WXG100 family type VII secretion target [Aeromicrobium sp.]
MGELQVTGAVVNAVAQELHTVVGETTTELAGLDGRLHELLGSGWTGQAGAAFGGIWQRWHEGGEQLVRGLETMAALLEQAAQGYQQTDAEGAAAIDSAGM